MIKLDRIGRQAIYYVSPYFSRINLTGAYIKSVKWDSTGQEGVIVVIKNNNLYKIGLFPKLYKGTGSLKDKTEHRIHNNVRDITAYLTRVGRGHFKLGYIYNLRYFA